jgi:hypothetical protein
MGKVNNSVGIRRNSYFLSAMAPRVCAQWRVPVSSNRLEPTEAILAALLTKL